MKIQLGVLFGGKSTEHEISIISAVQAMLAVNRDKYDVVPLYITKDNRFYTGEALLKIENYRDIPALLGKCERVTLVGEGDVAGIYRFPPKALGKNRIGQIDLAFPIVHGTNTEDGTLAGFIEMLNIPYVGCDVTASALGMDKYAMKAVFADNGIPVLPCRRYTTADYADPDRVAADIEAAFAYPVIVKPAPRLQHRHQRRRRPRCPHEGAGHGVFLCAGGAGGARHHQTARNQLRGAGRPLCRGGIRMRGAGRGGRNPLL